MKGKVAAASAVIAAFALGFWLGSMREIDDAPAQSPASSAESDAADPPAAETPARRRPRAAADDSTGERRDAPGSSSTASPPIAVDDPTRPTGHLRTGRVTLFSRSKYGDYEKATFSFKHGIRDDPGLVITNNTWDLMFGSGSDAFDVGLSEGSSTITDLGAYASLDDVARSVASAESSGRRAMAVEGHAFLVHTTDAHTPRFSAFHVVELIRGDLVTFDWATWTPPRSDAHTATLSAATRLGLATLLDDAAARADAAVRARLGEIKDPGDLILQLRSGSAGGSRCVVTLGDPATWRRVKVSEQTLDCTVPPDGQAPAIGYARGGYVPEGMALVVEALDVFAVTAADGSTDDRPVVSVRGETIRTLAGQGPVLDWFAGRAVIRHGDERSVAVQAEGASVVEVRLHGRLVSLAEADALEPVAFRAGPAPTGAIRAAGAPAARSSFLVEPRAVLQVCAAGGGGNPMRVSLIGPEFGYLRKLSKQALAPGRPPDSPRPADSIGHIDGGRIPPGMVFVVTRIDYEGYTTKDGGHFLVEVLGTKIASIERERREDSATGTWTGRIAVPAGSEQQVILETSYFGSGSATIYGEFVDAAPGPR